MMLVVYQLLWSYIFIIIIISNIIIIMFGILLGERFMKRLVSDFHWLICS